MSESPRSTGSIASAGRSTVILATGAVAGQVLAIFRELFLAAQVGIDVGLDALLVALIIPMTLSTVISTGTVVALVPAYLEARTFGVERARRLSGVVLFWIGAGGSLVALGLFLFAGSVIGVVGPGLPPASQEAAVGYLQALAPLVLILAVTAVLYGVLQAEGRFVPMAISGIASNATMLVVLVALWGQAHLWAFAAASFAGPIAALAVLLTAVIQRRVFPLLRPMGRELGLRALARHAAPLTLSQAILQVSVLGDRAIASLIAPGAISALRYGEVLVRLPLNVIGSAWGDAIYPTLVRSRGDGEGGLGPASRTALRFAIALFVPVSLFLMAAAPMVTAIAYGRGAFGQEELQLTALVVAGLAPLVATIMNSAVLSSALNAQRRGTVLLIGGILHVAIGMSLNLLLGLTIGVVGLALSASATYILVLVFFAWRLSRSPDVFGFQGLTRHLGRAIAIASPGAILLAIVAWGGLFPAGLLPTLITLVVTGTMAIAIYLIVARTARFQEPLVLVAAVVAKVLPGRGAQAPAEGFRPDA